MPEPVNDYSAYVNAVYLIALVVYGGLTLLWQQRLRRLKASLRHLEESHGPAQ